ncbi:MAG: hypothetical protein AB6733_04980 [Clostridiaceae bacterium]
MKINSLYKFYSFYFGYEGSSNKKRALRFVFAIKDTIQVLEEAYFMADEEIIEDYCLSEKNSQIAVKFLRKLQKLSSFRSEEPLLELDFFDCSIKVPESELIKGTRGGINIPFQYIWDNKKKDVILLSFGGSENFIKEVEVLFGLIYNFSIDKPFNSEAKTITYWNISNGIEESVTIDKIKQTPKDKLITALNNYIKEQCNLRKKSKK